MPLSDKPIVETIDRECHNCASFAVDGDDDDEEMEKKMVLLFRNN